MCQLFGVGRAVVRRVLERLAYDGIVALRPNKGAVIAEPMKLVDGAIEVPTGPGMGIDVDINKIEKYRVRD